jgi:hypothetical protein
VNVAPAGRFAAVSDAIASPSGSEAEDIDREERTLTHGYRRRRRHHRGAVHTRHRDLGRGGTRERVRRP